MRGRRDGVDGAIGRWTRAGAARVTSGDGAGEGGIAGAALWIFKMATGWSGCVE